MQKKVIEFLRGRLPLICILLFVAMAWGFAEYKYKISNMASLLLLRLDEPPEYTKESIKKNPGKKKYAPKETVTGLRNAQRKAGVILEKKNWDRMTPVYRQQEYPADFIADTCLKDWAMLSRDPANTAIPSPDPAKLFTGKLAPEWQCKRFTILKGELNLTRVKGLQKEIWLAATLHTLDAIDHAKLLITCDGALTVYFNGKEMYQTKKDLVFQRGITPVNVTMTKGNNTILLKWTHTKKQKRLRIRITDHEDLPLNFKGADEDWINPAAKKRN